MRTARVRRVVAAAAAVVLTIGLTTHAGALAPGAVKDQENELAEQWTCWSLEISQTFTAGLSGDLTDIVLSLLSSEDNDVTLSVEIRNVANGLPGDQVLATSTVTVPPDTEAPTDFEISFSTPAQIVAGTQYAIVVLDAGNTVTGACSGTSYDGGEGSFIFIDGTRHSTDDFRFVTFVAQPDPCRAVPTPAARTTAANGYNVIVGTNGEDEINGTAGNDLIYGLGGDDDIEALGGNDHICGGDGEDEISGGRGNDTLNGGLGPDDLEGDSGTDHCIRDRSDELSSCETRAP